MATSDGGGRAPKPRNEVPRMRVGEGGEGYRKFWNEKAYELCSDKEIRHKLNDKVAIQGAINTSWTLYKSGLLDILSWCMSWKY